MPKKKIKATYTLEGKITFYVTTYMLHHHYGTSRFKKDSKKHQNVLIIKFKTTKFAYVVFGLLTDCNIFLTISDLKPQIVLISSFLKGYI